MKIVIATGKRKKAIARAIIRPGKGRVWINGVPLEIYPIEIARVKMQEPLQLVGDSIRNSVDIKVNVRGGGYMAQAEAVRMAIARGLLRYTGIEELSELFSAYDVTMLSGDPRRTEPKKYMRYSARRRRQKSYR